MPKLVDEAKRKNDIANAAIEIFASQGFSETTVQQIADAAGISKGSIYVYFESKTEVLHRIFQNFESNLHTVIDRIAQSSSSPRDKLKSLIYELGDLVQLNRSTIKVLFDFWSHSLHSDAQNSINFQQFYGRLRTKIEILIEDGANKGEFRKNWDDEIPSILIGFFEGQLIQWLVDPSSPDLDQIKESGYRMLMDGLTK